MLLISFFQWWYGAGWLQQVDAISRRVTALAQTLSVSILLRTLWSPWKQVVTNARADQSVQLRMNAVLDNTVSRLVGFMIRIIVLVLALMGFLALFVSGVLIVVLWPVLPVLVVLLIPLGFLL